MKTSLRTGVLARWVPGPAATALALWTVFAPGILPAAGPAAGSPEIEIKKHPTGKEGTIRHGEKEWYIYIDVDDNRTMILRTEASNGKETQNHPEIVERPMSNAEVDRVINDWVSGVKSTLKP